MNKLNYSSIVEEHIKSLDDNTFLEVCSRLLEKLFPDHTSSVNGESAKQGIVIESVLYKALPYNVSSKPLLKNLLPKNKIPFNFCTLFAKDSGSANGKIKEKLNKLYPGNVFNIWSPLDISGKILSFEMKDITFILGSNSLLASYMYNTYSEERNRSILKSIFDYLFNAPLPDDFKKPADDDLKLKKIEDKIPLNFGHYQYKIVKDMFVKCFSNILLAEQFLKYQLEIDSRQVDFLIKRIRMSFCEIRDIADYRIILHDYKIIEKIAKTLVQPEHRDDDYYIHNATAIVFLFFEACEFGARTEQELKEPSFWS